MEVISTYQPPPQQPGLIASVWSLLPKGAQDWFSTQYGQKDEEGGMLLFTAALVIGGLLMVGSMMRKGR